MTKIIWTVIITLVNPKEKQRKGIQIKEEGKEKGGIERKGRRMKRTDHDSKRTNDGFHMMIFEIP